MNEAYQAHDGLPPDLFPPDIPTYTGTVARLGGLTSAQLPPAAPVVHSAQILVLLTPCTSCTAQILVLLTPCTSCPAEPSVCWLVGHNPAF